ncbi:hypothetical protein HKX48_007587 [Thoreauomyces humboldtii]|nr:hypothetical protein HKX48_007587 [Thoreauomyces humboldtii]
MYSEITYSSLGNKVHNIPPRRIRAIKVLSDTDLVTSGYNDAIAFAEDGNTNILTATIPQGTYTVADFSGAIAAAMSTSGSQAYTCTYSNVTRRLTIATTGSKNFKILEGKGGTTAYPLMGMSKNAETGPGRTFTTKDSMNLSQLYPLHLVSNIPVQGARYLSDFNDGQDTNVLCSITPDSISDVVSWVNDGEFIGVDQSISSLEFHLIDSQTLKEVSLNSPLTVRIAISDDVADFSSR